MPRPTISPSVGPIIPGFIRSGNIPGGHWRPFYLIPAASCWFLCVVLRSSDTVSEPSETLIRLPGFDGLKPVGTADLEKQERDFGGFRVQTRPMGRLVFLRTSSGQRRSLVSLRIFLSTNSNEGSRCQASDEEFDSRLVLDNSGVVLPFFSSFYLVKHGEVIKSDKTFVRLFRGLLGFIRFLGILESSSWLLLAVFTIFFPDFT